jgi:hypothetical protein
MANLLPKPSRSFQEEIPDPLYLGSVLINDMVVRHPGCDRPLTPWSCETVEKHGRHIHILNKPAQLRGPISPHRKEGTQNWEAGISVPSIVACVPLSTQGRLCVLDTQDSCFLSHDECFPSPAVDPSILSGPFPTDIVCRATQCWVTRPDSLSYLGKGGLEMFIPGA